jgi:hypothetical protein
MISITIKEAQKYLEYMKDFATSLRDDAELTESKLHYKFLLEWAVEVEAASADLQEKIKREEGHDYLSIERDW